MTKRRPRTEPTDPGFFIPYRYADGVKAHARQQHYHEVARLFADRTPAFAEVLSIIDGFTDDLRAIGGAPPPAPRWAQDWFPRLDAAALYSLIRHHRPARIVEVGAGHSTRFAVQAARDGGFAPDHAAVDPAPRATITALPLRLITATVQEAGFEPFAGLSDGDVLVIDSSHVLMPGSDVDLVLNAILPGLAPGVFVHFHDIFLPEPYPAAWDWRGYNEQQGVATLLLGGGYRPVFASRYVLDAMANEIADTVIADLPLPEGAIESSLWLRKLR